MAIASLEKSVKRSTRAEGLPAFVLATDRTKHCYRFAATIGGFTDSVPVGMVVTLPELPCPAAAAD